MSSALSNQTTREVSFPAKLCLMETLADWIRGKLLTSGRSAADLARFCKVSRANITHWTSATKEVKLKAENLYALASFFGADVTEIPGALYKPPNQRGAGRAPHPNNPYPNADAAMLAELFDLASALPVTRKAKLLELARLETKLFIAETETLAILDKHKQ